MHGLKLVLKNIDTRSIDAQNGIQYKNDVEIFKLKYQKWSLCMGLYKLKPGCITVIDN